VSQSDAENVCLNVIYIRGVNEMLLLVDCSLDVNQSDAENVRLNVIHIRGVNEMSTRDVFDYFAQFAPTAIEWIDDSSCMLLSVCPSVCLCMSLSVSVSLAAVASPGFAARSGTKTNR